MDDKSDVKLEGYVLFNTAYKKLTHKKLWDIYTPGWIWSEAEVRAIVVESKGWQLLPMFKQAAYLSRATGQTVLIGEKVELK